MLDKGILVAIVLSFVCEANAMELIKLTCSACQYEKKVTVGSTKSGFLRDGLREQVFFCATTKEFLEFQVVGDEQIFKKSGSATKRVALASATHQAVETGSNFVFYTHPRCENQLIPLDFYRAQTAPNCPICSKGELSFETLRFVD
jgi:hypothetical protein